MISDIVNTISGRIKFCIQLNGNSYFITDFDNGNAKDAVDGKDCILKNIETATITTFSSNTIPNMMEIEAIKNKDYTFFENNKASIEESNKVFDELVLKAKDYLKVFTDNSEDIVKRLVIEYQTKNLDFLKILKSKRAIVLGSPGNIPQKDAVYIRGLYFSLINEKLKEALEEIDKNIAEADDEDFTNEANQIKKDLDENVKDFILSMRGTEYKKLFNQWPTLLNPSPFADVE